MLHGARGCPRCPVVFRQMLSNSNVCRLRESTVFVSVSTHQPPMYFDQQADGLPPRIAGGSVSTVHQGWVAAPNDLATFESHDAGVDFIGPSVWKTRNLAASNPRSSRKISSRCCQRSPPETSFPENGEVPQNLKNRVHRQLYGTTVQEKVG